MEHDRETEAKSLHLRFLENTDRINRIMQRAPDLEALMSDVLAEVLAIFGCDRAALVYPCDPKSATWTALMERTRPEYPGIMALGIEIPTKAEASAVFQALLDSEAPVRFGPQSAYPLPPEAAARFNIQSQMAMAFYPKGDKPWMFVIHQCSYPRVWSDEEARLFQEIGRRLADSLTSLLILRDLRKSEERLRSIVNALEEGVVFVERNGRVSAANPRAEKILGLPEGLLGRMTAELAAMTRAVHEDGSPVASESFPAMVTLRTGQPQRNVTMGIHQPDGTLIWLSINSQPLIAEDQREPHAAVVSFRDISELKRTEAALKHSNRELQAIRDELQQLTLRQRAILDNAAYGIISAAVDGTVTSFNFAAERLLGYKSDEVIGRVIPAIWHDPTEIERRAREVSEELREVIAPGFEVFAARPRRGLPEENEWTFIRKDGTRIPVLLSITALRDEKGLTGFVGLTYDLTERKRSEQALRRTNEELHKTLADLKSTQLQMIQSERLAALGTLAAGIAHELNNPLMGIMGYVNFAHDATRELEVKELLGQAGHELERMRDLITNMLGFARPGVEGELTLVNIPAMLERTLALLKAEFKVRAIALTTNVGPELPPVLGQTERLQQVMLNLLMNARDAVEGRPERQIRVNAECKESQVVIAISDTGIGIPAGLEPQLFDPFFTTKPPGKGTGLGLPIARNIVAALGGSITYESREGEGTTFTVTLPVASAHAGDITGACPT